MKDMPDRKILAKTGQNVRLNQLWAVQILRVVFMFACWEWCWEKKRTYGDYCRKSFIFLVGATGFEPATLCSQSKCATKLRHAPKKRAMQRGVRLMGRKVGLEPTATWATTRCSAN